MAVYKWDPVIEAVIRLRIRSAASVGVPYTDLLAIGRLSAVQAEQDWDPEGGRSLSSWVYLQCVWDVQDVLRKEAKALVLCDADVDSIPVDATDYLDSCVLVRQALTHLQAKLPSAQWTLLWTAYASGRSRPEIAASFGINTTALRQRLAKTRKKAVTLLAEFR